MLWRPAEGEGGGPGGSAAAAAVMDAATADRLQAKLKAATYGTDPLKFFAKFDADKCVSVGLYQYLCVRVVCKRVDLCPTRTCYHPFCQRAPRSGYLGLI